MLRKIVHRLSKTNRVRFSIRKFNSKITHQRIKFFQISYLLNEYISAYHHNVDESIRKEWVNIKKSYKESDNYFCSSLCYARSLLVKILVNSPSPREYEHIKILDGEEILFDHKKDVKDTLEYEKEYDKNKLLKLFSFNNLDLDRERQELVLKSDIMAKHDLLQNDIFRKDLMIESYARKHLDGVLNWPDLDR